MNRITTVLAALAALAVTTTAAAADVDWSNECEA
jgi:hypothetical protein